MTGDSCDVTETEICSTYQADYFSDEGLLELYKMIKVSGYLFVLQAKWIFVPEGNFILTHFEHNSGGGW